MAKKLLLVLAAIFAASARRLHYEAPSSHQDISEQSPTHDSSEEPQHELSSGMQSIFDSLKDDPVASKYIKNPPKDEKSYNELQTSIVNAVKSNE